MTEQKDELPNIFAHTQEPSTIRKGAFQSSYVGMCFLASYEDVHKMQSRREFLGRLLDLQPEIEHGKLVGIRMLYRTGSMDGEVWREGVEVRNDVFGPFDQNAKSEASIRFPGEDESMIIRHKVVTFALSQSDGRDFDKNMRLKLQLVPGM